VAISAALRAASSEPGFGLLGLVALGATRGGRHNPGCVRLGLCVGGRSSDWHATGDLGLGALDCGDGDGLCLGGGLEDGSDAGAGAGHYACVRHGLCLGDRLGFSVGELSGDGAADHFGGGCLWQEGQCNSSKKTLFMTVEWTYCRW
jgi:hypothetical protein